MALGVEELGGEQMRLEVLVLDWMLAIWAAPGELAVDRACASNSGTSPPNVATA